MGRGPAREPSALGARARLLAEILRGYFARPMPSGPPTDTPAVGFALRNVEGHPNPLNPRLTISFEMGRRSDTVVSAYDLRGERVATVHRGPLEAGRHRVTWNGRDDRGVSVASGVYVVQVEAGHHGRFKATLLK